MSDLLPAALPILSYARLSSELSDSLGRTPGPQALLLVDLHDLFDIQAQLGFEAGDAFMDHLARELALALGERGAVRRLGNATFCVLIDAIRNDGHATLAANKLLRLADSSLDEVKLAAKSGLSIGIALYPRDATEPPELLRKAQLASAAARRRSQRVLAYDDGCADQALQSAQLGTAFAEALKAATLTVHYQPQVRVSDRRVAGAEALMRWLRDGQVVAPPDVFIPLAEKAGLIHDATWYALANSLRTSAACGGLHVGVNITPGMLHHREFVGMIETAVRSFNVPRGVLTLELTEGALVADFGEATERLRRVRELGVRVSIDDFGTGYSSLSYFKKIPADEIKIDKSFIMRLLEDQADQRLVQAIIVLARQFELEVVAEGVEDEETMAALARMGCDHAQGYLFAPALGGDRLRAWLGEQAARADGLGRLKSAVATG